MPKSSPKYYLGAVIMLGAVWGMSETALGLGIQKCASLLSGSIMTGVALFFIASGWVLSRRLSAVFLMVLIASLFKMFDALLLSLPVKHGAVANPIFAFVLEGAAFLVMAVIFKEALRQKKSGQALLGGSTALLAVGLFPLAKFATGIPACVFPGTSIPLSIYFGPLAVALSVFTVPLAFWAAEKFRAAADSFSGAGPRKVWGRILSPATLALCLAIAALVRLA